MAIEPVTHLEKTIAGTVEPVTHLEHVISEYGGGGGGGGSVTVDAELSASSENPVQNKVINAALAEKGTYSKPSGGIPKSDLSSAVQTSLGKADTALQSVPSGYATEAWVTNKGYQTAAQVQTAISGVRQLPVVSSSDNGKFLRVVSGAWAAVTVPPAESNSF